jgi:hypothetical protein
MLKYLKDKWPELLFVAILIPILAAIFGNYNLDKSWHQVLNDSGQAGEADVTNYGAPMRCGDMVGMNDRGVFVPQGMTRAAILRLGAYIEDKFEISKYLAESYAIDIIQLLRRESSERWNNRIP